jgi:AraC-like DNA-binding protein
MLAPDTNRAMAAIRLLDVGAEHGVGREVMLAASGLSEEDLAEPDRRIPFSRIIDLWTALVESIPDPDLGLKVGCRVRASEGGVLGYAMLHSPTLGNAIKRFVRFGRLVATNLEAACEVEGKTWRLYSRRPPPLPGFRQPIDATGSGLVTTIREITQRQVDPVEVRFSYERPDDLTELRRVFRSDLIFGEPRGSITFRAKDMELQTVKAEVQLSAYLERLAEIEAAALPRADTFARRAARLVWRRLSEGQPTIDEVASELGVSVRTFQRRLREEGTTYADVIESLRKQMSPTLLRDKSLAVYEVAYLLGYADPSTFYRAFRRWHGTSPAEYRQQRA